VARPCGQPFDHPIISQQSGGSRISKTSKWPSRLLFALALSSSFVAAPALAGTVARIDAPAASPATYPGAEPGRFRTWVQLVWDAKSRRLERLSFTAWDPIPSLGLDLAWQPENMAIPAAGAIEGQGTLTFRRPGAAAYDSSAIIAQYRGEMRGGRADGPGDFVDRHGFVYSGNWRAGLMDGQGRLSLANGDEYIGNFREGQRNGQGQFTDSTGQTFDGRFAAGQRNGAGIVVPSAGAPYGANWLAGAEIPGTRHPHLIVVLPATQLGFAAYTGYDDLRIGVVTERRPHNYAASLDPMNYVATANGQALDIFPDDQRLLDVWHGTVPITLTDAEIAARNEHSLTPSFLAPCQRFIPPSLVFDREISASETGRMVGG